MVRTTFIYRRPHCTGCFSCIPGERHYYSHFRGKDRNDSPLAQGHPASEWQTPKPYLLPQIGSHSDTLWSRGQVQTFLGLSITMCALRGGTRYSSRPLQLQCPRVCVSGRARPLGSSATTPPGCCCLYCVENDQLTQALSAPASQACHLGLTPDPAPSLLTPK